MDNPTESESYEENNNEVSSFVNFDKQLHTVNKELLTVDKQFHILERECENEKKLKRALLKKKYSYCLEALDEGKYCLPQEKPQGVEGVQCTPELFSFLQYRVIFAKDHDRLKSVAECPVPKPFYERATGFLRWMGWGVMKIAQAIKSTFLGIWWVTVKIAHGFHWVWVKARNAMYPRTTNLPSIHKKRAVISPKPVIVTGNNVEAQVLKPIPVLNTNNGLGGN